MLVSGGILLAVVVLSEVLLPSLAAHRLRHSLERDAVGVSVEVKAFPAIELLAGRADSVVVHARFIGSDGGGGAGIAKLLARAANSRDVSATVSRLQTHGLVLREVVFRKDGAVVSLAATITRGAIEEALPGDMHLTSVPEGNNAFSLVLAAKLFGHSVSATARLHAVRGRLELTPEVPVLELFHFTLFDDPEVAVDSVRVEPRADHYRFYAEGHYT